MAADISVPPSPPLRPGTVGIIWQSVRPASLVVAVLPVLVGTAAVVADHHARPAIALACLLLAVLLQGGTNSLNDAEDALTGADDVETAGSSLSIRRGWITPSQARAIAIACFTVAAALGVGIAIAVAKPGLLVLGAAALMVGWAYTAPPLRLAYRPLGELASGLPMGVGITWGTAAAQSDHVPASVWWAAVPLALLIAAVLHANNARDRGHDALVGKRTLATFLSPRAVVMEYRALLIAAPMVVLAGIAVRGLPWECALALLPGGLAVRTAFGATEETDVHGWTMFLISSVRLVLLTGITLTMGLLLSRVV